MEKYSRNIDIVWDDDDKIYVASATDLPGCKAHGDTIEQALDEIEIAIELHLKCMEKINGKK